MSQNRWVEVDPIFVIQDLYFLKSLSKVALIETREASYIRKKHIHAEAFANFFQYHISGDQEKIDILQKWFPVSWPKFLKLLDSIITKES
jgi:hypothetical protein